MRVRVSPPALPRKVRLLRSHDDLARVRGASLTLLAAAVVGRARQVGRGGGVAMQDLRESSSLSPGT